MLANDDPVTDGPFLPGKPAAGAVALLDRAELEGPDDAMPLEAAGSGVSAYFHAFRRRWPLAVLAGVVCAGTLGAAAWFASPAKYTAAALLRVASEERQLVFRTMDQGLRSDFDTYRSTQQQLLKSRFVLTAAVRNPDIAGLPMLRRERDPIAWLAENLSVAIAGRSEIMTVQLSGDDPRQIATIVNACVQAYLNEVVDVERNQRRQRLNELDRVYTDSESAIRRKRNELKQLAEQLGTGDTAALNLKQQIALQQFGNLQNEYTRIQFERMRAEQELQSKRQMLDNPAVAEVSDLELESYAQADPLVARLLAEADLRQAYLVHDERVAARQASDRYVQGHRRDLERLRDQEKARKEVLLKELQGKKRASLEADIRQLQANLEVLASQETRLAQATVEARNQATAVGESSIDVELMRAELSQSEDILNRIAEERERLQVELRTESRITLLQKAEPPSRPDRSSLATLTISAALLGLVGPIFAIAWWDVRSKRVNTSAEIRLALGRCLIGSLPAVPAEAVQTNGAAGRRQRYWHMRLTEAVDGIVAALIRKAERGRNRVILVSSAARGEGKTTLATQLALSLARSGHCTLLVDFDLRRPALHTLFGTARAPGVGEVLRQEVCLDEAIRPVGENLRLLTAGAKNQQAMSMLARGAPAMMFATLRQQYEFVIVDGSPVLPVADVRFVCPSVDAVLLCILRDVSRTPQVLAAWELLRQLGVENLSAVVSGVSGAEAYPEYEEEAETSG
jgi:capsular exopolysaccharide synthesis family protein